MGLGRLALPFLVLGVCRGEELEFEDEEEPQKRVMPKTFEEMIYMQPDPNVTMLTLENFDELTFNKTCFINFCASWLTPCAPRRPSGRLPRRSRDRPRGRSTARPDCSRTQARRWTIAGGPCLPSSSPTRTS